MKKIAIAFFGLFVILASGCTNQPACNPPYIMKGNGCCLDQNSNNVCDSDETQANQTTAEPNYHSYEVRMHIQNYLPEPNSWNMLPHSPARHYDGYQIYNYPADERYYDGGWLLLYTSYVEEPITCLMKEYYDSVLYQQSTVNLTAKGSPTNMNGASVVALFKKENPPKQVRYEITCQGDGSGIKFQDAYVVGLKPP